MDLIRLSPFGSPTERPHTVTRLGSQNKPIKIKTELTSPAVAEIQ